MIDVNKLRLTDMKDFRLMPQIVEDMTTEYIKEQEKIIYKKLFDFRIDKDILKNQVQEIHRLNNILSEYKNLEEQGLLLKLPCKLGSTVYYIDKKIYKEYYIEEMEVEDITFRDNEFYISLYNLTTKYFDFCITSDDIGKTVFLTKEEALKRLEAE